MMVVGRCRAVVDMAGSGAGSHGTQAVCYDGDAIRAWRRGRDAPCGASRRLKGGIYDEAVASRRRASALKILPAPVAKSALCLSPCRGSTHS